MRDKKKKVDPVQKGASGEIGLESLPVTTYWTDVVRRFRKNKIAVVGLVMLLIIVILCAGAPLFTKYDPILDMDLLNQLKPPGSEGHILGTDNLGRDIWSRLLYGGRTSVLTGLTVALITGAIGVAIGLISGYFGGIVETILMRMTDIMLSFPFLIIAIAIMAALGSSQRNIILALAIVGWPRFARLTRGQVLAVKNSEYVESAKVAGFGNARIILNHILPNCMGPIIIQATLAVGGAILSASSLTYLGLGADAAAPDWGVMLSQGRQYLQSEAYLTIIPGLAMGVALMIVCYIMAKKYGFKGETKKFSFKAVVKSFVDAIWALLSPVIILGGIYSGKFTPTEAAVISVVYSYIVGRFVYKELDNKGVYKALRDTIVINGSTTFMVGLSSAFAAYLSLTGIPRTLAAALIGVTDNKIILLILINIFLLVIGCLVDNIPATIILAPILLPVVEALGMSPVTFGIMLTMNLAIGFCTPPYGIDLFVASAISGVSIGKMMKFMLWFIFSLLVVLMLVTYWPAFTMFALA